MFGLRLKEEEDKGIIYSNRVLIGNWYESSKLAEHKLDKFLEQMKKGDLMLARYRKVKENLQAPADQTLATGPLNFGSKIVLKAPYMPEGKISKDKNSGLLLGGRISYNNIAYSQELRDGCELIGLPITKPVTRCLFTIMSVDYCDRAEAGEQLKFSQEFMLALSSSVDQKKPLFIRYDQNPVPGLYGPFQLYLSEHPVSNARWRILPKQSPDITRFEQEGKMVQVNTDMIVNHVGTNTNLGIDAGKQAVGLFSTVYAPRMKTCLDIFGRELLNNIWQFYVPIID